MDTESNYLASEFVPEHFLKLDTPVDSEFYVFGFGQRWANFVYVKDSRA